MPFIPVWRNLKMGFEWCRPSLNVQWSLLVFFLQNRLPYFSLLSVFEQSWRSSHSLQGQEVESVSVSAFQTLFCEYIFIELSAENTFVYNDPEIIGTLGNLIHICKIFLKLIYLWASLHAYFTKVSKQRSSSHLFIYIYILTQSNFFCVSRI